MLNILYGPPGSGKTTAVQDLKSQHDIKYISVGQLYRKEMEKKTDFSKTLKGYIESGLEYPTEVIKKLVESSIIDTWPTEIILVDGFPKYQRELDIFQEIIANHGNIKPGKIIILDIQAETAEKRVLKRIVCLDCDYQTDEINVCPRCGGKNMSKRQDDNMQEFTDRFNKYIKNNKLVVDQLSQIGFKSVIINANQDKASVRQAVANALFEV